MVRTSSRGWLAATVVVLAGALAAPAIALATPANALAAPAAQPRAHVRVLVDAPVAVGEAVTVRVTHLAAGSPVTVDWGDGRTSRRASGCDVRAARAGAARCSRTATAAFDGPGDYSLRVRQQGQVIEARIVSVVATPTSTPTATSVGWQDEMLDRVNDVRARSGVAPLRLCLALTDAAQAHAVDMASRDYFSHDSVDGRTAGDRIEAAGYRGRTWGENIAAGYRDVAAVMTGWIESPGHYANLVRGAFTHIGLGRAEGNGYGTYWVQDFGAGGDC